MALESFVGEISVVAFDFAPQGWMSCNGQILSISQYTALFSLLGTRYGGNGQTTFALPNLNGRAIVGVDNNQFPLGGQGGSRNISLTRANLPAHAHSLDAQQVTATATIQPQGSSGNGTTTDPTNAVWANVNDGINTLNSYTSDTTQLANMKPIQANIAAQLNSGTTGIVGGSQPFDASNPYLALNYIICINGIYPSRP